MSWPACVELRTAVEVVEAAWLNALNISTRNWIFMPSRGSGMFLKIEMSQSLSPGRRMERGAESKPGLPFTAGSARIPGFIHW